VTTKIKETAMINQTMIIGPKINLCSNLILFIFEFCSSAPVWQICTGICSSCLYFLGIASN